jgi:hypothetical protein
VPSELRVRPDVFARVYLCRLISGMMARTGRMVPLKQNVR